MLAIEPHQRLSLGLRERTISISTASMMTLCKDIQVLESSWHAFLNRLEAFTVDLAKGETHWCTLPEFPSSKCIIWTQCSGSHQSALQGPPEKSCVWACTKSTAKLILWRQSPFPSSAVMSIEIWPVQQQSVSTRFFAGSPTRWNKNSMHSTSMSLKTWSTQEEILAWYRKVCDLLQVLSEASRPYELHSTRVEFHNFFPLLHEIVRDSHILVACFKLPASIFQHLDMVLNVASLRDRDCMGIFLFISCLWRFRVCQLSCWFSHQPPCQLRQRILQPGWRDSIACSVALA